MLTDSEEGAFDFLLNPVFSKLMMRRRGVQFYNVDNIFKVGVEAGFHLSLFGMFKPGVSVFGNFDSVLTSKIQESALDSMEAGQPYRIQMRIVSDGRRALVRPLE